MNGQRIRIIIIFFSFIPFLQFSKGASLEQYTLCRNRKIVRTIRVNKTDDGCSTYYTKAGKDRMIGSGKKMASCKNIVGNVRGNLEKAGWKCKEIAGASIVEPTARTTIEN